MKKKILAVLLLAVLLAMSMAQAAWAANTGVVDRINELRNVYKQGYYWNHYVSSTSDIVDNMSWSDSRFANSVTSEPCATHKGYAKIGQYDCNPFGGAIQCDGFARKVFYDIFGQNWSNLPKRTDKYNIQVGDYLWYANPGNAKEGHACIVIGRNGNTLSVVECNLSQSKTENQNCRINWGRTVDLDGPMSSLTPYYFSYFKRATNYDEINNSVKQADPLPSADIGSGFYAYIYNPASGMYVENVNQNAQLGSKKEGELGQLWYFSSSNDLSYRIINMADGSYLNVEGGKFAAHTNVNLTANPASNSISHKWYVCGKTNECYIASAYANGEDLVLDVFYGIGDAPIPLEGRNIWLCDNCYKNGEGFHAAETFQIIKVDAKDIPTNLGDDFYAGIGYLGAKTSYLTIDDEPRSSGKTQYRRIETTQTLNWNDPRQIWHFVRNANGYYQVTNEFTGWSMYLRGGSAAAGQEVVSWGAQTNDNNQRWYVLGSTKNGRYNLATAVNYPWALGRNLFLLNVPVAKAGATAPDGTNTNIALQNADSSQFTIRAIAYNKPARPATPTGFTVSYDSNGISCKWNAVPVADKWDARYYQLALYKVAADGTETRLDAEQVGDVTSYTRAGALEPGNYIISIQALNKRYRSWASGIVQKNFTIYNNYTVRVAAQAGGSANGGGTYREGLPVTLTATPSNGYHFTGWQDAANGQIVSTELVYTFTANANRSLTACFTKIPEPVVPTYQVVVSAGVGGTANGGGIYKQGEEVSLQAIADTGYKFVGWQEAGNTDFVSREESYCFEATADRELNALFEQMSETDPGQPTQPKYSVRLSSEPAEGGTVRGGGIYNQEDNVTVRAEANNGWDFANWQTEGRIVSTQSVYSLRADADVQLVAHFTKPLQPSEPEEVKTYTINLSSTIGGTVSGSGSYHAGENVTVRATADEGYKFVRWQKNEELVSDKAEYTFRALADCDLVAVFATLAGDEQKLLYTITVNAVPELGGTVSGGGVYEQNKQVTLKATANKGYTFAGWQDVNNGAIVNTEAEYSFEVTENRELAAIFNEASGNTGGSSGGTSGGGRPTTKPGTGTETKPGTSTETKPSSKEITAANIATVFGDVQNNAWYSEAIAYVYNNGMMNGTEKGFEPNAATTRAMIVTMLHRLNGTPAAGAAGFADVAGGQWYSEAVAWAAANGVVKGYSDTKFAPNEEISREQLAAILYRYAQFKGLDVSAKGDLSKFADGAAVSGWAQEAMQWAVGAGLLNGNADGSLAPAAGATRAEVAMILMRFAENVK